MSQHVKLVERFLKKSATDENYWKFTDDCHFTVNYRDVAHSICNLRFNLPNEILAVFHSR